MSRNQKTVKKNSKKSVKKIITEMNIIDGIKNNDLTGLVNCDTLDTIIELYKKIAGCIDAVAISSAIEDYACAEKFFKFALNYKSENGLHLCGNEPYLLFVGKNSVGENVIYENIYNSLFAQKFLVVNSLKDFIDLLCGNCRISYSNALIYLKKNFREELIELTNSAYYNDVADADRSAFIVLKNCNCNCSKFSVNHHTEVILRMFNANPK